MNDDLLTLDLLLNSLCTEDREIIVLWFIEGYNMAEIAKILRKRHRPKRASHMDYRKVGKRINEILEKLRKNAGISPNFLEKRT